MNLMMRLFKEEEGQGMTEYALIIGLIALAAILSMSLFGEEIVAKFEEVTTKLGSAGS
jgi:pilus assembly protein Flp/PilA